MPRFLRSAVLPLSTSSAALDMRRASGDVGPAGPSSSSMALSGILSELMVETLTRRAKAEACVGDVPLTDIRLR